MQTAIVKLSDLNESKYNPRKQLKPGDSAYEKLKASIQELGFVEPIIVNSQGMTVIGGHQRLRVLRDLGKTETTVILVDFDDKQEKSLNIALNKIKGEWDYTKLDSLLQELKSCDGLLQLTGFDEFEINTMFTDYNNIDDLIENDFGNTKNKLGEVRSSFNMTFGLPEDLKECALSYTSQHGKKTLSQTVLSFVSGE